jgi:hypothetical protein
MAVGPGIIAATRFSATVMLAELFERTGPAMEKNALMVAMLAEATASVCQCRDGIALQSAERTDDSGASMEAGPGKRGRAMKTTAEW